MLTASTPLGIAAGRFATFRIISRGQIRSFRRSASFLQWVRFPAAPPEGPYLSGPLCWDYHLRDDPKSTLGLVQCSTCSAAATWTRFLASGQGAVLARSPGDCSQISGRPANTLGRTASSVDMLDWPTTPA